MVRNLPYKSYTTAYLNFLIVSAEVRLRESSFSNKLTSVPVAVDIYQTGDTADGKHHVISFRISDYQIDSNPGEQVARIYTGSTPLKLYFFLLSKNK